MRWKGREGREGVVAQSCPTLATPWTVAYQAPLSMRFSRQEYWSGLPLLSPGDLPDPGIEPGSPALESDALTSEPPGKQFINNLHKSLSIKTFGSFSVACFGSEALFLLFLFHYQKYRTHWVVPSLLLEG